MSSQQIKISTGLQAVEPLRNRVPTHDENGRSLGDFMMIIPGLRNKPEHLMRDIIDKIQLVCGHYGDIVVFAELNVQLNLLWISHRHRYGVCPEIAAAFRKHIPEALLVGWGSNI